LVRAYRRQISSNGKSTTLGEVEDFLWMLKPISKRSLLIREEALLRDAFRAGVKNVYRIKRTIKT
tara:strand:- start:432 stop:626 length:195 start_codon:yes stop_codon:yes gene_type:complete